MFDRTVALVSCPDYAPEPLRSALDLAWSLAPPPELKGKSVLLKPNVIKAAAPEEAATTHPEFLRAVIRRIKAEGAARIIVGESPGYQSFESAARRCGIAEVIRQEGAELDGLEDSVQADYPDGAQVKAFRLGRAAVESDIVISLPKLKTHSLLLYTGALKNLFGLIPGFDKAGFHFRFRERAPFELMLVDLARLIDADYAIMDAVTAMEGPGPGSGYPRHVGRILTSRNLLALDRTACRIIGYDPERIGYLARAMQTGHWLSPGEDALVAGEDVGKSTVRGFKILHSTEPIDFRHRVPRPFRALARTIMAPKPFFSRSRCALCSGCIKICPAGALAYADSPGGKRIMVDYRTCIRCYCCHEICPEDAIALRRFG